MWKFIGRAFSGLGKLLGISALVGVGGSLITGESSIPDILNAIILAGLGIFFIWLLFKFIKR